MVVVWAFASGGTGCPCRCGKRNGGLPSLLPACLAFSLLLCPPSPKGKDIPPTRARSALFPGGEGGDQGYFMQGASPLASPAFDRLRHLQTLPCRYPGIKPLAAQAEPEKQAPGGGLPPMLPDAPVAVVLAWEACLFGRLPSLPLAFFVAPYPPPPFPGGEGGTQGYFMQGASPLASPGLNPGDTGETMGNRLPSLLRRTAGFPT